MAASEPFTVAAMIEYLKSLPQDMKIVKSEWSEHVLLEAKNFSIDELCVARPDGWVHEARPDKETERYLVIE